ncbi:unnamed protein product [Closterium sp. NIES-54]
MECVVEGIIESKHVRALVELIEGITGAREEKLDLHQLVYRNAPNIGAIPCSALDFAHRSHAMRLEAFAPLRLPRQHAVSDAQPLPSLAGLHVVEVTAAAAAETYTETAAALSSFADLIAP